MFALVVRFYLHDEVAAERFDALVAETASLIKDAEPGTLIYAVHRVKDAPLSRVFYELYASREAFDQHESMTTRSASSPSGNSTWLEFEWNFSTHLLARVYDVVRNS